MGGGEGGEGGGGWGRGGSDLYQNLSEIPKQDPELHFDGCLSFYFQCLLKVLYCEDMMLFCVAQPEQLT